MTMLDGNTAALRRQMSRDDQGEEFLRQAEMERKRLVAEFIEDERGENAATLSDRLGEFMAEQGLSEMQRMCRYTVDSVRPVSTINAAIRLAAAFTAYIDHHHGDELVQKEAARLRDRGVDDK